MFMAKVETASFIVIWLETENASCGSEMVLEGSIGEQSVFGKLKKAFGSMRRIPLNTRLGKQGCLKQTQV